MDEVHDLGGAYMEVLPQKFRVKPENLKIGKKINSIETIIKVEGDEFESTVILPKVTNNLDNSFHQILKYKKIEEEIWEENGNYMVNGKEYNNLLNKFYEETK